VFVNENFCKDVKLTYVEDLFFHGLGPGDTKKILGPNTLGRSNGGVTLVVLDVVEMCSSPR